MSLARLYRDYIACLNSRDLSRLGEFVAADVTYNGEPIGLEGYRRMLEEDYRAIPDLRFEVQLLVADGSSVAARLAFDCHPAGRFLGLDVDGRRARFCENVMYGYADGKIARVWSVIDKVAVERCLSEPSPR
ncbi:ester cyclase [Luteimonas wenzhouensis]|uniref:Ester cyclase n=1 Tax=Luteimonas wenzhouensis TaxID=2599615 RepID=A0A5C5U1N4_9GAMM|nr:ester cyclase [Luteimonas wenzhouensis]TWT19649.1 ester cyclase [Luteimonas wenzhouensis]